MFKKQPVKIKNKKSNFEQNLNYLFYLIILQIHALLFKCAKYATITT